MKTPPSSLAAQTLLSTLAARTGQISLWLVVLWILLPLVCIVLAVLQPSPHSGDLLTHLLQTVLPGYASTSLYLCLAVSVGSAALGLGSAALVTLVDFKGRRHWEWLLLLPLAMPAYVSAYAYTDFLQFSGPAQSWLRATFDLQGRVLPEIRNTHGAAFLFSVTLYPYIYVLTRAALSERAGHLLEAAQMLGAHQFKRLWQVALPLARPALAAGVALVLMEVLADFGVSSYFGIQTFSAGIYKAWLVMDDRNAAIWLALTLLASVSILLWAEQRARHRMRYNLGGARQSTTRPTMLRGGQAILAHLLCATPVLLGFVLPVLMMTWPLLAGLETDDPIQWNQFTDWASNSLQLGLLAAVLATATALLLAAAAHYSKNRTGNMGSGMRQLIAIATRLVGLGYAVPGAVIVIGLLLPVAWWMQWQPDMGHWATWITTTIGGLIWAYMVRFCAVALHSVQSGYARMTPHQDAAARLLGANPWRLITRIHLPLLRRPLLAATLLVFVDIMKELPATLVLRPFNYDTLAVVAHQLARDERLTEAAIPSLALVAVGLLPVLILSASIRQSKGRQW